MAIFAILNLTMEEDIPFHVVRFNRIVFLINTDRKIRLRDCYTDLSNNEIDTCDVAAKIAIIALEEGATEVLILDDGSGLCEMLQRKMVEIGIQPFLYNKERKEVKTSEVWESSRK